MRTRVRMKAAACTAAMLLAGIQLFATLVGVLATYGYSARAILAIGDDTVLPARAVSLVNAAEGSQPQIIDITASKFQFSPSRITLKKGRPITIRLTSTDGAHGLAIPALKVDADVPPGGTAEVTVTPRVAGTFKAFCDRYCGTGHGNMKMNLTVVE
jgi:cytochrome c oxidase subunit II